MLPLDFELESSSLVSRSRRAQSMGPGGAVPRSGSVAPFGAQASAAPASAGGTPAPSGLAEGGGELRQGGSRDWPGSAEEEPVPWQPSGRNAGRARLSGLQGGRCRCGAGSPPAPGPGAPGSGRGPAAGRGAGPGPLPRCTLSGAGGEPQTKSRGRSRAGTGARRGRPGGRGRGGGGGQRHRGAEPGSGAAGEPGLLRSPGTKGSCCPPRAPWPGAPQHHAPQGARLRLGGPPDPLQPERSPAPGEAVSTGRRRRSRSRRRAGDPLRQPPRKGWRRGGGTTHTYTTPSAPRWAPGVAAPAA